MWWRNPLRIAAVLALGALNAACFQPLYASRSVSGGTPLGTQLAQVQVEHIDAPNGTPESRVAVELQNALDFEMSGGGGLISPTHRLKVRMTVGRSSIISASGVASCCAERVLPLSSVSVKWPKKRSPTARSPAGEGPVTPSKKLKDACGRGLS